MEGSDKTESPSQTKLQELREEGIVPFSREGAFLCATGVVLLGTWAFRERLELWWGAFEALVRSSGDSGSEALSLDRIEEVLSALAPLFFAPVLGAALIVLLIGLLQTRFLFRLGQVSFQAERLWGGKAMMDTPGRLLTFAGNTLLAGIVGAGVGIVTSLWSLGMSRLDAHAFGDLSLLISKAVCLGGGAFAVASGLIAIVLERLAFMRRHRMSRREIESEGR